MTESNPKHTPWRWLALAMLVSCAAAAVDVTERLTDGSHAVLRNGRILFIECVPPPGPAAETYLRARLADGDSWKTYAGKGRVAVPYRQLKPVLQRELLLTMFPSDYVDADGWHHVVRFAGEGMGQETLWTLCEWLTGSGTRHEQVAQVNQLGDVNLTRGQLVLFPAELLPEAMRETTPSRIPLPPDSWPEVSINEVMEAELDTFELPDAALRFGSDDQGPYAEYLLRPGDQSIYTPVVVRFTDYRENVDILDACEIILRRSGIRDVTKMETGQPVRIPLDMVSAQYLPGDSPQRVAHEEAMREARRLRDTQVTAHDLAGVVVVLDPGHGGKDPGAQALHSGFSLYEDEVVYDIACRIREILAKRTRAKVYMTVQDKSQGFAPVSTSRFRHDEDEELLTTPPYPNENAKYSANLRWYLANSIFDKEVAAGTDPRKILFASIHCDSLFNATLRGAMVYIPGAQYRRDFEAGSSPDSFYNRFAEARAGRDFRTTAADRKRDEALSHNFAGVLLEELGEVRVKRHDRSNPIRNVIRRSRDTHYVPAVLRNNKIPTKVLVEAANMTNVTDCERMADPEWRQLFAEGFVNALLAFYGE
jgi:N-acetylmuramoyl-L-alanine amidase